MERWRLSAELSEAEQRVVERLKRTGRFYVFLRQVAPRMFDDGFQAELEKAYEKPRGTEPKPPALLAMVTLLQAYDRVGDAEAVETAEMDRRWQLVLGCLGATKAPFSQGVLVSFRERMVAHDLDRKLLDRTVELAKETGLFSWKYVKTMLDSSPLLGAGRVEDTWNLIGRALDAVVDCAAAGLSIPRERILDQAGLKLMSGSSLKATLDIDWDDPAQQAEALQRLLGEVEALRRWVNEHAGDQAMEGPLKAALDALQRVLTQDLEPDPEGGSRIRRGVAKDRMPSLGDKEMRHGRKSKSKLFNGYKRHVVGLVGTDLVVGAVARPANEPEHEAATPLLEDARRHGEIVEAIIDRGYLASTELLSMRQQGVAIRSKPWPSRNAGRFTTEDFAIHLDRSEARSSARRASGRPSTPSAPWCTSRPAPVGPARCAQAVPRRHPGVAVPSPSTNTRTCSSNSGPSAGRPRAGPPCASERLSSTASLASEPFRDPGPVTRALERTPSTFAAAPPSTISKPCEEPRDSTCSRL